MQHTPGYSVLWFPLQKNLVYYCLIRPSQFLGQGRIQPSLYLSIGQNTVGTASSPVVNRDFVPSVSQIPAVGLTFDSNVFYTSTKMPYSSLHTAFKKFANLSFLSRLHFSKEKPK